MLYRAQSSTPRMFVGLMVVVAVHVAGVLAIMSGLVRDIIPTTHVPTAVIIIDDPPAPPPPPPRPGKPVFLQPDIPIPVPPLIPDYVPEAPAIPMIDAGIGPVVDVPQAATGAGPDIREFQVDSRFPLSRPEYPPQSIRLNEQGTVVLRLYVLPNGRVGEVSVERSSGHRRLDAAALREARRGWRFKPRTVDGQPVGAWGTYAVRFTLEN
jgi:protein TonB